MKRSRSIQWAGCMKATHRRNATKILRYGVAAISALCGVLTLASCGALGEPSGVTGTWDAILTITGGTQSPIGSEGSAVFTLSQSGSTVTGTFITGGAADGELFGTADGNTYSFTITQSQPCIGNFSATATLSGLTGLLQGSYSGSSCAGSLEASFVAVRR